MLHTIRMRHCKTTRIQLTADGAQTSLALNLALHREPAPKLNPASSAATPILRATKRIFPDWNEFLRACNIVTEISRSTS
jgi:hypothetical protein